MGSQYCEWVSAAAAVTDPVRLVQRVLGPPLSMLPCGPFLTVLFLMK